MGAKESKVGITRKDTEAVRRISVQEYFQKYKIYLQYWQLPTVEMTEEGLKYLIEILEVVEHQYWPWRAVEYKVGGHEREEKQGSFDVDVRDHAKLEWDFKFLSKQSVERGTEQILWSLHVTKLSHDQLKGIRGLPRTIIITSQASTTADMAVCLTQHSEASYATDVCRVHWNMEPFTECRERQ